LILQPLFIIPRRRTLLVRSAPLSFNDRRILRNETRPLSFPPRPFVSNSHPRLGRDIPPWGRAFLRTPSPAYLRPLMFVSFSLRFYSNLGRMRPRSPVRISFPNCRSSNGRRADVFPHTPLCIFFPLFPRRIHLLGFFKNPCLRDAIQRGHPPGVSAPFLQRHSLRNLLFCLARSPRTPTKSKLLLSFFFSSVIFP